MGPSPLAAAAAPLGFALLAAAALGGCSGTRFGDQLARSFSEPSKPVAAPAATKPPVAVAVAASPASPASPAPAPREVPAPPGVPAPYRVTLRLPAADSSAPAERVTQALRAAGVSFEVETIERIPASVDGEGGSLGAPRRSPAPPPR